MKLIYIATLMLFSSVALANDASVSDEARLVWTNTGLCLALFTGLSQTTKDPSENKMLQAAVTRSEYAFINASLGAGVKLESSTQETFYKDMTRYRVLFDKLIPRDDMEALEKLYDKCAIQFM